MITYDSDNKNNDYIYNYTSPQLRQALEMVKEAVQGEKEDELFYDYLLKIAPTQEEKDIIKSIRDDEIKHNKLFRKIYKDFTGQDIKAPENIEFKEPKDYISGIKQALFGELKAVEKYREIRKAMPNRYYRDILFDIITDELKHANKYNFIYAKNMGTNENKTANGNEQKEVENKKLTVDKLEELIEPLMDEVNEEVKEILLLSALVGAGYTAKEAEKMVEEWEEKKEKN